MYKIRSGVFETNSSSVHTIVIQKDKERSIYPIDVKTGCYGWSREYLATPSEKASYFYTALCDLYYNDPEKADAIITELMPEVIRHDCTFERDDSFGIDHFDELRPWVEDLMKDRDKLMRFIFGKESYVFTRNDNMDYDEYKDDIVPDEDNTEYDVFIKYN